MTDLLSVLLFYVGRNTGCFLTLFLFFVTNYELSLTVFCG